MRAILYLCAPYATRTLVEHTQTQLAVRKAVSLGWAPIFYPFVMSPAGIDDAVPEQREAALECCEAVIPRCDAFLIVGMRETSGMSRDLAAWNGRGPTYKWPDLPPAPDLAKKVEKDLEEDTKLVKRIDSYGKGLRKAELEFVEDMVRRVVHKKQAMTPDQRRWAMRIDEERVG